MWRFAMFVAGCSAAGLHALVACSFDAPAAPDSCSDGLARCGETCVDTQLDPANCGACGTVCDGACEAGVCPSACDLALTERVRDAWGTAWDGRDRTAATLAEAQATCDALGATLPSATALYRARATSDAPLAGAVTALPLWSLAAEDATSRIAISLADGAAVSTPPASATAYRCVCARAVPDGLACHGAPGEPCATAGDRLLDSRDRVPLRASAALSECAQAGGALAEPLTLVAAAQAGVPGSGSAVRSADRWNFFQSTAIAWTGAGWVGNASDLTGIDVSLVAPFRCEGRATVADRQEPQVAGHALADGARVDLADRTAQPWMLAHDACVASGGHLPRSVELARAVMQGLPNGSGAFVWTADQTGYHPQPNDFLAATLRWTGVEPAFSYRFTSDAPPDSITWLPKLGAYAFRCLHYAVDPAVVAPTACEGGCFEHALPSPSPARSWFDSVDRPAAVYDRAIDRCRTLGGVVASERDLAEAIRAGLPGGSNVYLWTSELGQGLVHVVRWMGVATGFRDQFSAGEMTWLPAAATTLQPYRCRWTNELR